jgi:alpha-2-macroglobulin
MQRTLIIAGVALGVAGASYLGYRAIVAPGSGGVTRSAGTSGTASGPTVAGPTTVAEQPSPYFAFRRVEVETTGEQPEACIVFTRRLDATGGTRYEDYLTLDPGTAISVRATEDRLCIQGLAFGQTYQLTMKKGLPAVKSDAAEKLDADETVTVELRDKPALVEFGTGLILPRDSADGVPINTVNVQKLDVKVIRVGARLLSQLQTGVVDQRQFYSYEANQVQDEQGAVIWEGQMDVPTTFKNQSSTVLFPLRKALDGKQAPGVFLVMARDARDKESTSQEVEWAPQAAQFVIDTNTGLTTFTGADGLTVYARGLASGQPLSGVELALVARNNEELERVRTDSTGKAKFAPGLMRGKGGMEPVAVMAYGAREDFTFLDLRRPSHDLTDRGVEGRATPAQLDAYLYTDRGIYRPGETVHAVTMVRDQQANAVQNTPLTFILQRPDGLESRRFVANQQQTGGVHTPVVITASAPRGRWTLSAYADPNGDPIGRVSFDVSDFVPQKLKVTLKPAQAFFKPGDTLTIATNGRFLYGAPGSGLNGEGTITIKDDSDPFKDIAALKGFRFGKVDETFEGSQVTMQVGETDAKGDTNATAALELDASEVTLPLKAEVTVSLYEPGGRTTSDQVVVPIRTRDVLIGVRPGFENLSVQEGTPANFEIAAVDPTGKMTGRSGVTWELVKENIDYQWYQVDNAWKYERVVRDRIVDGGKLDLSAQQAAKITSKPNEWGSYRLTVADPASGATTSVRYWAGYGAGASGDRPDRVAVTADKASYNPGDSATLDIRPPSDGRALIVVASNKIHWEKEISVSASGTKVSVPVSADWGAGAYAMVTHYRPLNATGTRAPARSIGVAWLGLDPKERTLTVTLGTPEKIEPRRKIAIPVTVENAKRGETVHVTLAAVDEGILQLTDFESPDPAKYFLGKRRLGLDMRDDYGRLIEGQKAVIGELRTGGDGVGGRSLAVVPQKNVALFGGLITLNDEGKGTFTIDVPDFNGELRLMAVAYTPSRAGHAEKPLTVRDPVVAELVLPRFLAPGDRGQVALNMHNVEGAGGTYKARVSASGATAVPGGANIVDAALGKGERKLLSIPLNGSDRGIGTITLSVEGPGGFKVSRDYPIEVRDPQLPVATEEVAMVSAGQSVQIGPELLSTFAKGTSKAAVTLAGSRGFDDIPGQLRWLDRYPYGCVEQTTSRAFPLVYYNELAKLAGLKTDQAVRDRVQDSVYRVLDMQTYEGAFGMWSAVSDAADPYMGVFTLDFLANAKDAKYTVPNEGLERSLKWARTVAGNDSNSDVARAYAYYVLTRAGKSNPSELRYFSDTRSEGMTNAMGLGFLGAALTGSGDRARAAAVFTKARGVALQADPAKYGNSDYGSLLRDTAGLTAMAAEAEQAALIPALVQRITSFDPRINDTTTQEKAWMILAAHKIEATAPAVTVAVQGAQVPAQSGKVVRFGAEEAEVNKGITITNNGSKDIWRIVSAEGIPAAPLPPTSNGVNLSKAIRNMDGTPANLGAVRQNDRFLVVLSGQMSDNKVRQMAILDLIPAGFEIEGMVQRNENGSTIYPFIPQLAVANVQEARDDRYVATFTIGTGYEPTDPKERAKLKMPTFNFAYIVRATIPGAYAYPAGLVEDMYAPSVKARTSMGAVQIAAQ